MAQLYSLILFSTFLFSSSNAANILFLSEVPSPSHHLWYFVRTPAIKPNTHSTVLHSRLRTVALKLANDGHNITFVSCDADVPRNNLHFIHMEKVYENIYASDGFDLNLFEMGSKNVLLQYLDTPPLVIEVCDGLLRSNGWKQLNNYPNGFKVIILSQRHRSLMYTNCSLIY